MPPDPMMKWSVQWCLTVPHGVAFAAAGTPAVMTKQKTLIVVSPFVLLGVCAKVFLY